MKIQEIITGTDTAIIAEMKSKRYLDQPDVAKSEKELDPLKHDIFNPSLRPDKKVRIDAEEGGTKIITTEESNAGFRYEKVARIAVALQKLIVKRAKAFLFGNPVELISEPVNDKQKQVLSALKRVLYDVKSTSLNRRVAGQAMSCTEVAELWYPVENENNNYGFKSKYKLRVAIFSPLLGDTLYPYFDNTGDMVAFSRAFKRTGSLKTTREYFETYTDEEHMMWVSGAAGFEPAEGYPHAITIGKIPVVFGNQPELEWQDVQTLIDRLEKLLSNFADTIDYHASPKIFTTGHIEGFSAKGEAGAIIEGEDGATAQYLAWANAPDSVKLEIETLLRLIYTLTQTPDISFDAVKGLGAISGVALKLLFMDAHLKVMDHQEVFDEYLQRRINVIKAFIGKFNTGLASECEILQVEPQIVPFMIDDEKSYIEMLTLANGNKPLVSQKRSADLAGLSQDAEADFTQIELEADKEKSFSLNEPTLV